MRLLPALAIAFALSAPAIAAQVPDALVVTGPNLQQISIGRLLVTPIGGTQATLSYLLSGPGLNLASPSPIGSTIPNTGAFTMLNITSAFGYQQNGNTLVNAFGNSGNMFGDGPGTVTLVGLGAGASLATADYLSTFVGWHAGNANTGTNTESTGVGWNTQGLLTNGTMNTTFGINTLGSCTTGCSHNIAMGTDSIRNGSPSSDFGIGVSTLIDDSAGFNMAFGDGTYKSNVSATGQFNIAIGPGAFTGLSLTSGGHNIAIGTGTAVGCTSCGGNVFIGHLAGASVTHDISDTFVGFQAGQNSASNGLNTFIGQNAGKSATGAAQNTAIGAGVGQTTLGTGHGNLLIGSGFLPVDTPASFTNSWLNIENAILVQTSAPTIASGFGTSPTVPLGTSSAAFEVNVGTGGTASTGVVLIANPAPHGWACDATDITNPASFVTVATPLNTTSITLTNYSRTTGVAIAWAASDVVLVKCNGF